MLINRKELRPKSVVKVTTRNSSSHVVGAGGGGRRRAGGAFGLWIGSTMVNGAIYSGMKGPVCFVLKFPLPLFSPLPSVVQISKQNRH